MKILNKSLVIALFVLFGLVHVSFADTSLLEQCSKELRETFPRFKVDRVLPSPIDGVCEIWAGTNVFYYVPGKKLLIFGEIWSSKGKSLTAESKSLILAERIGKIDLSPAIKWGKGKVRVLLFIDPDCPFCKRVERELFKEEYRDKITVYLFLYPLSIHPRSVEHSVAVICSKDPVKTLVEGNFDAVSVSAECKNEANKKIEEMKKAAEILGVRGTPVIVVDKKVIRGARIAEIKKEIQRHIP